MEKIFKYESPFGSEFDFEAIVKHDRTYVDGNGKRMGYIISENGNKYNASEITFPSPIRFAIKKGKSIETKLGVFEFIKEFQLDSFVLFTSKTSATLNIDDVIVEISKLKDTLICVIQN